MFSTDVFSLRGRAALVTGAGSGIGAAVRARDVPVSSDAASYITGQVLPVDGGTVI